MPDPTPSPMRRRATVLALSAGGALLAGCTSDADQPTDPTNAVRPNSTAATASPGAAPATFNPCDGLVPERVSEELGAEVTMDDGSATSPRCAFNPAVEGGPVLDANYSLFPDGLDAVFASMTELDPDAVQKVDVPGADAARIVTDFDDQQLFLSGFVQNGDLIQTIDLVAPEPYDQQQLTRGVRLILGEFSKHALTDSP